MRVLVVDDHETVRKGVCTILSTREDIEVCGEAGDGRDAIEKARKLMPDLIISDITMPGLNGFDTALEIRKFLPNVPILFLTMHDTLQMLNASKTAGAQGYIIKGQAARTLLNAVDALLAGRTFFPSADAFKASDFHFRIQENY